MQVTEMIIAGISILLPAVIVITAIIAQYKKKKKYYESVLKAVELGKNAEEIKQIFAIEKQKNNGNAIGFLRGGVIVSGIGIGLAGIALVISVTEVYAPSLFIIILGLALIAIYYLTKPKGKTK
ncbi:unnamed protein product [marine sediment metagenome]|uniref:DUF6249 domain-containing protein n=1 Tax=marine sediment metagenome TaxID=412755 RepID=X1P898_9ZZZZ